MRNLEKHVFPKDAWPLWDIIGVLTLPNVVRLKAVLNGEVVGFIAGDVRPFENIAWIATLAVLPELRRKGIGSALLKACEARLKPATIRLNVRASNQAAIQLYRTTGYQQVGMWPEYYQDGENALIMEKKR